MSFKKKRIVIMLPTQKVGVFPILKNIKPRGGNLYEPTKGYYYTQAYLKENMWEANHLYILSAEEKIKEGDWFYDYNIKQINIADRNYVQNGYCCGGKHEKIIAATDKSLNLPQPSFAFIQKYIEEYNKGNVIEEVMVEYEFREWQCGTVGGNEIWDNETTLKISEPNTITIKEIKKESWTTEEVDKLCRNAYDCGYRNAIDEDYTICYEQWKRENLQPFN